MGAPFYIQKKGIYEREIRCRKDVRSALFIIFF